MPEKEIPDIIVGRLPIYLRALRHMHENKQETTSSQELGEQVGISAAQIRKDLSQFGGFGKQGTGYEIKKLINNLCIRLTILLHFSQFNYILINFISINYIK